MNGKVIYNRHLHYHKDSPHSSGGSHSLSFKSPEKKKKKKKPAYFPLSSSLRNLFIPDFTKSISPPKVEPVEPPVEVKPET